MKAEKKSVAERIVEGLEDFVESLKNGDVIEEKYSCHKVVLDLQPAAYAPKLVKDTRRTLGASQFIFAQFLGVSVQAVRSWEQGKKEPSNVACRFMDEIRRNPEYWKGRLRESVRPKAEA